MSEEKQSSNPFECQSEHVEALGDAWATLLDGPQLMPQVVSTVISEGGTRTAWQSKNKGREQIMLAWPQENLVRAAVVLHGEEEGKLIPATAVPLLEGAPNDMTLEDLHPWANGIEAHVAACRNEDAQPLWFYTPLYFRDREALSTPGVRHTVMLAGLAYGLRRALLDDMTLTDGPSFESWAQKWLEENPDKGRLDVPPLKLSLRGANILLPSPHYTVYQMRTTILAVEECLLDKEKIYLLRVNFGLDTPEPLDLPVYATARVCKKYVPAVGDEVDAIIWLQGRLLD